MAELQVAKARFREAAERVDLQRAYEGRSTRTGNQIYQDGYDTARSYIAALEEHIATLTRPAARHRKEER